jgi:hypothetical protein
VAGATALYQWADVEFIEAILEHELQTMTSINHTIASFPPGTPTLPVIYPLGLTISNETQIVISPSEFALRSIP